VRMEIPNDLGESHDMKESTVNTHVGDWKDSRRDATIAWISSAEQ